MSKGPLNFVYLVALYPSYYVSFNLNMILNNEYLIESRIGFDNMMFIVFAQDYTSESYGYTFTIDYDGYFALYDEGGNGFGNDIMELIEPTYTSAAYRDGDWNVLTIEQYGNVWYGYVNDVEVFRIDAQPLYGNNFGFMVVTFTMGEADYIHAVWYR